MAFGDIYNFIFLFQSNYKETGKGPNQELAAENHSIRITLSSRNEKSLSNGMF